MMNVCFTIFVFNFLNHISNLIHRRIEINLETKLCQKVRQFCFNVLRDFVLKMQKLPRLSDIGSLPNCGRSAFLRFVMASAQSSLIHLPGCFWICRNLWNNLISYWYYCFIKLQNWIGVILDHFRLKFSLHICSYWGKFALSNLYRVDLSHTV